MNFFSTRPNRSSLKRSGIVKERLFACDLGEHLLNSDDEEVPAILKCCSEVLEVHGIVDGIYRLSGAASTINKLRNEFDEGRLPELTSENYIQDIHSISSLLKMYFRELPNPLLTYELYDKFIEAITGRDEEVRLTKICDVIKQLPPPHYRTAEYLFRHLNKMASQDVVTSMHCKNLAIVWAPNLLRSKELEQMNCGTAALRGVGIQAVVTEYLIRNVSIIFNEENQAISDDTISSGGDTTNRALRSIMVILPSSQKLLSLEEAQERKSQLVSTHLRQKNFIEVGAGAAGLLQYHTVINPPKDKKKLREKLPSPSRLRTFFRRSQSTSFKENQASEVATKPSSAREKKSAAIDSSQQNNKSNNNDSTDSTTTTTTTNNKRNLSTSALLSNGSPAGDASFGILDDLKRLSTSCEISAELTDKQNKSKKLKTKHRSTSVDVASNELNTLLVSVAMDIEDVTDVNNTISQQQQQQPKDKTTKKKSSAHRRSPITIAVEDVSKARKVKKARKKMEEAKDSRRERIISDDFVMIDSKEGSMDDEQLLDKPVLASDESDFKSDSLEAFEIMYADGLHTSKEEVPKSSRKSNLNKNLIPAILDVKDVASNPQETNLEINPEETKGKQEIHLRKFSSNDFLEWNISSDLASKDLYKELSPTFNNIWMESGCFGIRLDGNESLNRESDLKRDEGKKEKEIISEIASSAPRSNETFDVSKVVVASTDEHLNDNIQSKNNSEKDQPFRNDVTEEDLARKINDFHFALNILEQSCDLQPKPVVHLQDDLFTSIRQEHNVDHDDDPVFALPGKDDDKDKKVIERNSESCSPEYLPRPVIKSTSSADQKVPPSSESLSDAALDLFSFDRMYSSESLGRAKLQVNNEDGYVYASYRDLYTKPSNDSDLSSRDQILASAPIMSSNEEHDILRKLSSYGSSANDRTVMMPVGNAAKKFDSCRHKTRNTIHSNFHDSKYDETFPNRPVDVCAPPPVSQASTDPLRRKEKEYVSPASSSCKEPYLEVTEFLFRPSSEKNSAFRNHHHRHSSRHFKTPSPEIFHSSVTPPPPTTNVRDSFGTSSVRVTNREVKMYQDRSTTYLTSEPSKVEHKVSKHQPPVIIFNKPSNIQRNKISQPLSTETQKSHHFVSFGSKHYENPAGQLRSPTQLNFCWPLNSSGNVHNFDSSRKSLPTSTSQFLRSLSLDENGEEEKSQKSSFKQSVRSYHPQICPSSQGPFVRSETHHTEYSTREEKFYHNREVPLGTAKCFNSPTQKSSHPSDRQNSVTPPTQNFVLAKKQLFENNSNC